jgi:hypothetical protein
VARDIQERAPEHGSTAIATLAQILKSRNERVRVGAATILLDRGYGRAPQTIVTEGQTSLVLMHLAAARALSTELQAELGERPLVTSAEPQCRHHRSERAPGVGQARTRLGDTKI